MPAQFVNAILERNAETAPAATEANCQCCANGALLALFASSALWFAAAMGLALLASFKFHMPQFLADQPFFTYGRVVAGGFGCFSLRLCGASGTRRPGSGCCAGSDKPRSRRRRPFIAAGLVGIPL